MWKTLSPIIKYCAHIILKIYQGICYFANVKFMRFILVVVMSVMVLAYSGGITIAKHFCRTELIDLAINGVVKKCDGAKNKTPKSNKPIFSEKSCCSDVVFSFKSFNFQLSSEAKIPTHIPAIVSGFSIIKEVKPTILNVVPTIIKSPPRAPLPIFKVLGQFLI